MARKARSKKPARRPAAPARQEVWLATGSEIIDWYVKNYLKA